MTSWPLIATVSPSETWKNARVISTVSQHYLACTTMIRRASYRLLEDRPDGGVPYSFGVHSASIPRGMLSPQQQRHAFQFAHHLYYIRDHARVLECAKHNGREDDLGNKEAWEAHDG